MFPHPDDIAGLDEHDRKLVSDTDYCRPIYDQEKTNHAGHVAHRNLPEVPGKDSVRLAPEGNDCPLPLVRDADPPTREEQTVKLSVQQASLRACVSESVVWGWIRSGQLPFTRDDEAIVIEVEDLDGLLANFTITASPEDPP